MFLIQCMSENRLLLRCLHRQERRLKSKRAAKLHEVIHVKRALKYYDTAYPPVYGKDWWDIRNALTGDKKLAALVNGFSVNEKIMRDFEDMGAFDVGKHYTKLIERSKNSRKANQTQTESTETNENLEDSNTEEEPPPERPRLYKDFSDEEKAMSSSMPKSGVYPDRYKQMGTEGTTQPEDYASSIPSRLLKAQMGKDTRLVSMHDYVPSNKLIGLDDWVEETDVFLGATEEDKNIGLTKIIKKGPITWPERLKLYSFSRGDLESSFPSPMWCGDLGVLTHYLIGAASVLPVLALDVQRGETVLDMCAGPGGKSLAILQTLQAEEIEMWDLYPSRVGRIQGVMDTYIPKKLDDVWDMVDIRQHDGLLTENPDSYDKILVDVPCLNDRLSVNVNDGNIFNPKHSQERLSMPELQAGLLYSAFSMCRVGGSVVYATCTLSPLQNDGVVRLAMAKVWKETRMTYQVVNLQNTTRFLGFSFIFGKKLGLRYGHIAVPCIAENYGPLYFCRLDRIQ